MNRVVVIGAIIVAVVVAILAVGILSANHQNNNYTPTSTTTYTNMSTITNTNTTTPSTTTTSTTSTNTTTNTTTGIRYSTFYFLNQTGQKEYFVLVLSHDEYEAILNRSITHLIFYLILNYSGAGLAFISKTYVVGNYVFIIMYTTQPFHPSIGQQYLVVIVTEVGGFNYWFTYGGNWEGPSL